MIQFLRGSIYKSSVKDLLKRIYFLIFDRFSYFRNNHSLSVSTHNNIIISTDTDTRGATAGTIVESIDSKLTASRTFNNRNLSSFLYWEEKSKLNPDSNLLSLSWPGGKNLCGAGVVWRVKACWTG